MLISYGPALKLLILSNESPSVNLSEYVWLLIMQVIFPPASPPTLIFTIKSSP